MAVQTATDDEPTQATIYHRKFATEDGERHEVGADLGMGYEWAVEHDADPADVFPEAYEYAGTIDFEEYGVEADRQKAAAYDLWEHGAGHDPGETRSMAVGDIIIVGTRAWFVDRIGFEAVDIPTEVEVSAYECGQDGDYFTAEYAGRTYQYTLDPCSRVVVQDQTWHLEDAGITTDDAPAFVTAAVREFAREHDYEVDSQEPEP